MANTVKSETIHNVTAYADAVQGGFTGSYLQWCNILGQLSGDMNAVSIRKVRYVLSANGWSNGVYNLEPIYPSASYLFLFIDKDGDNMTDTQLSWWYAADMMGSTQNKIYAHSETPEVDLPILITMIQLYSGN